MLSLTQALLRMAPLIHSSVSLRIFIETVLTLLYFFLGWDYFTRQFLFMVNDEDDKNLLPREASAKKTLHDAILRNSKSGEFGWLIFTGPHKISPYFPPKMAGHGTILQYLLTRPCVWLLAAVILIQF